MLFISLKKIIRCTVQLRDAPLFICREGRLGNFPPKNVAEQKMCQGNHWKYLSSAFYFQGLVFHFKKFLHLLFPTENNHAQLKREKKNNAIENCLTTPPPPTPTCMKKNNGLSLRCMFPNDNQNGHSNCRFILISGLFFPKLNYYFLVLTLICGYFVMLTVQTHWE